MSCVELYFNSLLKDTTVRGTPLLTLSCFRLQVNGDYQISRLENMDTQMKSLTKFPLLRSIPDFCRPYFKTESKLLKMLTIILTQALM